MAEKKRDAKKIMKSFSKNYWAIASVILAILLIISLVVGSDVSKSAAGNAVVKFAEAQGISAEVTSVKSEGSLYLVTLDISGEEAQVYVTKDGKNMVQGIVSLEVPETTITGNAVQNQNTPKSDRPEVDLYVMSYCPYGVRAGNNFIPLVKLLKDSVNFKMRYIVSAGNSVETSKSLHGVYEAKQDAVQLIIQEKYNDKFWDYIKAFNEKCYSLGYTDTSKADACWKAEATGLGIDADAVEKAAYGSEGLALIKEEQKAMESYGVSGSPTLIINGVKSDSVYSGTESMQATLCNSFTKTPSACSEEVASVNQAAAGSC